MLDVELLLQTDGILILRPHGSLEATDFHRVAQVVDPYLETNRSLQGVLLDAAAFPGWKDFAALVAHLKFVKDHHRKINKIAAVSDSGFLSIAPKIASHFVQADVRHFARAQKADAFEWLREQSTTSGSVPRDDKSSSATG